MHPTLSGAGFCAVTRVLILGFAGTARRCQISFLRAGRLARQKPNVTPTCAFTKIGLNRTGARPPIQLVEDLPAVRAREVQLHTRGSEDPHFADQGHASADAQTGAAVRRPTGALDSPGTARSVRATSDDGQPGDAGPLHVKRNRAFDG